MLVKVSNPDLIILDTYTYQNLLILTACNGMLSIVIYPGNFVILCILTIAHVLFIGTHKNPPKKEIPAGEGVSPSKGDFHDHLLPFIREKC